MRKGQKPWDEHPHGTYTRYTRAKCRCDECREYQRKRVADNRAKRLAEGRITHGTRSGYDAGCRCWMCKRERRAAARGVDEKSALRRLRKRRDEAVMEASKK